MTFQELIDEKSLTEIFTGTSVDQVTQQVIADWFWDFNLCKEDENAFLRYFRKRCNEAYPKYMDLVRIETVTHNFDPFITKFMERLATDNRQTQGSKNNQGSIKKTSDVKDQKLGDETVIETPNLTEVRTPNLTNATQYGKTNTVQYDGDGNSSGESSSESSTENSSNSDSNSTARAFTVQYPEANLGSIPTDVDGYPTSVSYLQGESDTLSKSHNETSGEGSSNVSGDESSEYEDHSTTRDISSGIDTVTERGSETKTKTGMDTKKTIYNIDNRKKGNDLSETANAEQEQGSDNREFESIDQGRDESVADILPRAIKAIKECDPWKVLVADLNPCFNHYCFM